MPPPGARGESATATRPRYASRPLRRRRTRLRRRALGRVDDHVRRLVSLELRLIPCTAAVIVRHSAVDIRRTRRWQRVDRRPDRRGRNRARREARGSGTPSGAAPVAAVPVAIATATRDDVVVLDVDRPVIADVVAIAIADIRAIPVTNVLTVAVADIRPVAGSDVGPVAVADICTTGRPAREIAPARTRAAHAGCR